MQYLLIPFSNPKIPGITTKQIKIPVESLGQTRSIGEAVLYNHNRGMNLVTRGLLYIDTKTASTKDLELLEGAEEMTIEQFQAFMRMS